jgi:serine/threonine protein phosphatase PrpC
MQIQYGSHTNQGRIRTSNEDSFVVDAEAGLALVADGMGGHAAGEIASQMASSSIREWIVSHRADGQDAAAMLREAVLDANTRVYEAQRRDRSLAGMGSTLTSILFESGGRYHIAHVGDSRAYRLREGMLEQLTRDHSLVWHLYENGVLEKSELSRHPQKNLITRSVGTYLQVDIDIEKGEGHPGDVYLLCTDGLTDGVGEEELQATLSRPHLTPQEIAEILVDAANKAGGPDNITAVVIKLSD